MQSELTNFCEIDKYAIQSYCLMHGIDPSLNLGDISNVNTNDIKDFDLLVGGSPCFVAGTKILTKNGYKNIEDIKVGDMVLTHRNRYMPVVRIGGEHNKDIYSLRVQGFLETECTDYHPFYCKKTKTSCPGKIRLKDIKPGYYIGSHIVNNETIASFLQTISVEDFCKISDYTEKSMKILFVVDKECALRVSLMIEKIYGIGCDMKYNDMVNAYEITYNSNSDWFIEDGIVWYPVKDILNLNKQEDVYNIEVEEDHTYTANNMICYNCQDFSSAGKKEGAMYTCKDCGHKYNPLEAHYSKRDTCPHCGSKDIEITRSSLIVEYLRVLREKQPLFAVYENVKNLVNKEFRPVFDLFIEEVKEIGYVPYWQVLNAKDYGIPQNRERVIAVFIRKDIDHGYTYPQKINLLTTINDITQNFVPDNYYIDEKKSNPLVKELISRGKLSENSVYFNNQLFQLGLLDKKGFEQNRRVYAMYGISPTLTTNHTCIKVLDHTKYLFNINPSHRGMNGCVYDSYALSPTLTTNKGEGLKFLFPVITEYRTDTHLKPFCGNICGTLRTIESGGCKRLLEPMDLPVCVASRGRNTENPSSRIPGCPTSQRLEPNEHGTTNTLTSVSKDNYILENAVLKYERTDYGKQVRKAYENGLIKEKRNNLRTLVPREDGISNTLTTVQKDNYLLEHCIFFHHFLSNVIKHCYDTLGYIPTYINLETMNEFVNGENDDYLLTIDEEIREKLEKLCESSGYRVRKLTPRECFRLMGFNDDIYEKARYYTDEEEEILIKEGKKYKTELDEFGNERAIRLSDAQAYKQSGNSIVVNVLYHVFEELKKQYGEFKDGIKVCTLFSGIGAPEQALAAIDNEEILINLRK